jgi:signal transduction histidine kinase
LAFALSRRVRTCNDDVHNCANARCAHESLAAWQEAAMIDEHLYLAIRRDGANWTVLPAEHIDAADLDGLNVLSDLRAVLVLGQDPDEARCQVIIQEARGTDPWAALRVAGHASPGLTAVRARIETLTATPDRRVTAEASAGTLTRVIRLFGPTLLVKLEERVRSQIEHARDSTHEQFLDCLPLLLEVLSASMEQTGGGDSLRSVARTHGAHRQRLGWTIDESVFEYQLLCDSITELACSQQQPLPQQELIAMHRAITTSIAHTVDGFARRRESELRADEAERLGFVAHELRNPLTSARVSWDAMCAAGRLYDPFAGGMTRSLAMLTDRIEGVLSLARLTQTEEGRSLNLDDVDVASLVQDAEADSRVDAQSKQILLCSEVAAEALKIRGDYRLFLSAVTNLVRNGVKYTTPGGVVQIRVRTEQGRLLLEIHDGCGGLPLERAEKLFGAFTQAHGDRSGFGLGLSIAKRVIEAHGGTIMVRDASPVGCVFIVDLPCTLSEGTARD